MRPPTPCTSKSDIGYTGQRDYGGDFGLMDYNARFYSARLGRFTQPDTIVPSMNPQAWNRYSYVINNPIRFNDPSGHGYCDSPNADPQICNGTPGEEGASVNTDLKKENLGPSTTIEASKTGCWNRKNNSIGCNKAAVAVANAQLCKDNPWHTSCQQEEIEKGGWIVGQIERDALAAAEEQDELMSLQWVTRGCILNSPSGHPCGPIPDYMIESDIDYIVGAFMDQYNPLAPVGPGPTTVDPISISNPFLFALEIATNVSGLAQAYWIEANNWIDNYVERHPAPIPRETTVPINGPTPSPPYIPGTQVP